MSEQGPSLNNDQENIHGGYEERDVHLGRVVFIGGIFVVLLGLSIVFVNEFFIATKEKVIENVVLKPESVALRELRSHENEVLKSYKILDAEKGTYQISIDRAMELIAAEAYKSRPENSRQP